MSIRMSSFGIVCTLAAIAAFSFSAPVFAAGGNGNGNNSAGNGGSGFSGGAFSGGHASGGFGSGAIGSSGFNAGRMSGGFPPSPFAHSTTSGSHSGLTVPSFAPNGTSHVSPSFSSGSHTSLMPNSFSRFGHIDSATLQHSLNHWNNGQWSHDHWHWWGNGGFSPTFVFIPFFYGYGYYPQFFYGYDPYSFYALYANADPGLPPVNVVAANPIVAGADANAAIPNGAAPVANPPLQNPPLPVPPAPFAAINAGNVVADADEGDQAAGAQFFAQAESAFQDGRYHDAQRLAAHAGVESPRNPKAHELMSLSMFAAGDWRGAAIEAHAAIALGPIADWATLFAYYGDQTKYTNQLRALEKYSHENPKAADARFLRAYHYLMTGHTDAAKEQLAEAVKLTPNDKLATELLTKYSGNAAPGADAGAAAPPQPVPPPAAPIAPQNPAAGQQPANPLPPGFDS